jgi:YaiO family outer membrane protein
MRSLRLSRVVPILVAVLLACGWAVGDDQGAPLPQGSAIPGISIPLETGGGRGFVEVGGGHSALTQGNPSWTDGYLHAVVSGQANTFSTEITRQDRYGDTGWFVSGGLTHTFSENWYGDVFLGGSSRCFFLPKYRTDAFIHRKLLPNKQLIATVGFGYDRAKDIHSAYRLYTEGSYYLKSAWVLQGGVNWNRSMPGAVLGHTQYFAVTEGHEKQHYIALRGEYGREAYQLVSPQTVLVNFALRDVSATWRQWLSPTWGFNLSLEHYSNPLYRRMGGTLGFFLEF